MKERVERKMGKEKEVTAEKMTQGKGRKILACICSKDTISVCLFFPSSQESGPRITGGGQ